MARHGVRQASHHHGGDALIHWARLYDLQQRLWGRRGRRWRTDLARRLDLRPGDRVLDVACGTGQLAVEMASRVVPGGSVEGIDAASEMVERATTVHAKRHLPLTFQVAKAQSLPFTDATFTAVTCTMALHHVAQNERELAFEEFRRVLRPAGRLLVADFEAPTRGVAKYLARILFGHFMAQRPLDQAVGLFEGTGFTGMSRDHTTMSWIGVVVGQKPTDDT